MTIPQRILLHVALGAALVIAVATSVTYGIVLESAKRRDLQHLATYVAERARREEIGFQQVQANLLLVRGQFLKRMEAPIPRDCEEKWSARFELFPDGSWRSKTNFWDGSKYATLWAHRESSLTQEIKTEVLRAQDICDELLPGWAGTFPSVYFVLSADPGWLNIGFDPRIPNWVWDTPANYNATNLEWFQIALPPAPPPDVFGWTGVIEEPTTKVPIVSIYVPIFRDGQFLGSIGHDEYVNRMMDEITHSDLPGARHVIFRGDGRIVAHPTKLKQILANKGQLLMQHCDEPELVSLYRAVVGRNEKESSGFDASSGFYYSVARLAGPDWYFLTTMPRDLLLKQAFQSAQWVLWSGLFSLALVSVFLAAILQRQIAAPLQELTRATKRMSAGDVSARATVGRRDELGELACAFNEMAGRVAQRDAELRAERDGLETRVTERVRTARLNSEVAVALNQGDSLDTMLGRCCESLVKHLDAAFARMWILNERTATLELVASAGLYTHLDGPHSRIPLGELKIGRIAKDKMPHLTNAVQSDPRVSDHEWARRESMVAFAGYPLLVEGRALGVMGLFARHALNDETLDAMAQVADSIALGVERKTTEGRLVESEKRFSAAFRQSPAMQSLIRATDRVIVEVNDTFLGKLGFTREQVIGKTAPELDFWVEPEELAAFANEIESKGLVLGREVRLRAKDGRTLTVLLSSQPVDIGGVPHLLSAGADISDRKEAEAELRKNLERARELSELKSNFVSLVSHEFRTPLETIMSSVDNLDRYHDRLPHEKRQQLLHSIHKAVRRMAGMMEEVLVLGRLETDRVTFKPAPLDLPVLLRRICDEIESATNRLCPISLHMNGTAQTASGDESLLRHIFTNLLSNAVKYSAAERAVEVSISRERDLAICRVIDHGCGIPEADKKRLFQAFHRGSNVEQIPGTGLGLLIVQRCVELHGGEIKFTSVEGLGTTFTVKLPLFTKAAEPDPTI